MREEQIRLKEQERAALLDQSGRIVKSASAEGRELTAIEDARVLELLGRVRRLEDEMRHLMKHSPGKLKRRPRSSFQRRSPNRCQRRDHSDSITTQGTLRIIGFRPCFQDHSVYIPFRSVAMDAGSPEQ
jgi:hypothetical protein